MSTPIFAPHRRILGIQGESAATFDCQSWILGLLTLALLLLAGCRGPNINEYIADSDEPTAETLTVPPNEDGEGDANQDLVIEVYTATSSPAQLRTATAEALAAETAWADATQSAVMTAESIPATSTPVLLPTATHTRAVRPTSVARPLGAAMAKVNIPSLSLRRYPLDDAPVVGAIREGYEYRVSALSRDGKWVRLETPIEVGGRGWVAARFVSVFGEITGILITDGLELGYNTVTLAANQAVANTGNRRLRLRSGPGSSYDTVFFAFNGELFTVLEESPDGTWVHLSNPSLEADGWAARQYVRLASDPMPTSRPSPTPTPTVLLTPPTPRPSLQLTVEPGATRAATTSSDALATPNATLDEPDIATNSRIVIVTNGARLRVRSQPDADSEIVARVLNGEEYAVAEVSADGEWIRILLDSSDSEDSGETSADSGWIAAQFTRAASGISDND